MQLPVYTRESAYVHIHSVNIIISVQELHKVYSSYVIPIVPGPE